MYQENACSHTCSYTDNADLSFFSEQNYSGSTMTEHMFVNIVISVVGDALLLNFVMTKY